MLLTVGLTCAAATSAFATTFTFQSVRGSACVPGENQTAPISGQGSCTLGGIVSPLSTTEVITEQWRADFVSLGLSFDYSLTFYSELSAWSISNAGNTTGFATVGVNDVLTITGGAGDGILRVGLDLHGVTSVSPSGPVVGTFASSAISTSTTSASVENGGSIFLDVPFTYGTPFVFNRSLSVGCTVLPFGFSEGGIGTFGPYSCSADYFNSANFSFAVLNLQLAPVLGAVITSESGFVYPQSVAAVPEPASLLLLGIGLGGVATFRRRSGSSKRIGPL